MFSHLAPISLAAGVHPPWRQRNRPQDTQNPAHRYSLLLRDLGVNRLAVPHVPRDLHGDPRRAGVASLERLEPIDTCGLWMRVPSAHRASPSARRRSRRRAKGGRRNWPPASGCAKRQPCPWAWGLRRCEVAARTMTHVQQRLAVGLTEDWRQRALMWVQAGFPGKQRSAASSAGLPSVRSRW